MEEEEIELPDWLVKQIEESLNNPQSRGRRGRLLHKPVPEDKEVPAQPPRAGTSE